MNTERFFSVFGKVALVILVVGLIAGGIYALMRRGNDANNTTNNTLSNTTVSNVVNETTNSDANTSTETNSTTNTTTNKTTTLPADSTTLSITGKSPFSSYIVSFPTSWSFVKDRVGGAIALTLTKGSYEIVISQAPADNGTCIYPPATAKEMELQFGTPTEIAGTSSSFRLALQEGGGSAGAKHYLVCEKTTSKYTLATTYGYISVVMPPEGAEMPSQDATVKSIIASLKKN